MEHNHKDDHPHKEYSEIKTLLSWSAPGRPYRRKSREFYISGLMLVLLIDIILFIFSEYLLMFVVITLYFFAVALSSTPPQNFHYRISNQGIKIEDHFYIWSELYDFFFKRIDNVEVLIVRTKSILPGELKITLGDVPEDHVKRVLVGFIPYREVVRPTFMERSGEWLSHNFPLER